MSVVILQDKLQLVSVLGAGLLVGTALAVIIPEGVRALFAGAEHGTDSDGHCKFCNIQTLSLPKLL